MTLISIIYFQSQTIQRFKVVIENVNNRNKELVKTKYNQSWEDSIKITIGEESQIYKFKIIKEE